MASADANLNANLNANDRGLTDALRRAGAAAEDTTDSIEDLGDAADDAGRDLDDLGDEADDASGDLENLGDEADEAADDLEDLADEASRTSRALNSLGSMAGRVGPALGEMFRAAPAALSNPYVLGAAAVAAAGTAVVAVAAVAGAALTGLGLQFIKLGATALKESDAVKAAVGDLGDQFKSSMTEAASSLEGPLVGGLVVLRGTVVSTSDDMADAFAAVAPAIDELAVGLDGMITNTMPGLKAALAAAEPVLEALGAKLPQIGQALSDFFDHLAGAGPGAMKAFMFALDTLITTLEVAGFVIETAGRTVEFFSDAWNVMLDDLSGGVFGKSIGEIEALKEAQREAAVASTTLAGTYDYMTGRMRNAKGEVESLSEAFDRLNGATLDYDRAALRTSEAVLQMAEAVKTNGRSLDQATVAGQRNRVVLGQAVEAANRSAQAKYSATVATRGEAAALAAANGVWNSSIAKVRSAAAAAYGNKAAVDALIGSISRMPTYKPVRIVIERVFKTSGKPFAIPGGTGTFASKPMPLMAAGGPVKKGEPYIVGDGGRPELFVPNQNGTIVPRVPAAFSGGSTSGGAAGGIVVNVHAAPGMNEEALAAKVVTALQRYAKTNGPIRGITA